MPCQMRKCWSTCVFCDRLFSPIRCRTQAKKYDTTNVIKAVSVTCISGEGCEVTELR